jgi:predicted DCC family thiol-disulfide oxidoreductase YuxK
MAHPILLYDGVCGLCNRMIQFVLHHDKKATFRFTSLQSATASRILRRHGANPTDLDTFYVVAGFEESNEHLISRSDAAIYVLEELAGVWRMAAYLLRAVPRALRDWAYNIVAQNRYRIFGRYDSCPLPSAETRARFLDI